MKIYVDDERDMPKGFDLLFRTGKEFVEWLKENSETEIILLSLDNRFEETDNIFATEFANDIINLDNKIRGVEFHSDDLEGISILYHLFRNEAVNNPESKCHSLRRINPRKVGYDSDGKPYQLSGFDARDYVVK